MRLKTKLWLSLLGIFSSLMSFSLRSEVVYSVAVDQFHLMDQVSLWHTQMQTTMRDHWTKKFGFQQVDKRWFDGFAMIRRKYTGPDSIVSSPDNKTLFSRPELERDPLLDLFFESSTLEQALKKSESLITKEEQVYLNDFFDHYKDRLTEILKESDHFRSRLKEINDLAKSARFDQHLKRIDSFMQIERDPNQVIHHRAYLVWWPAQSRPEFSTVGPYTLMRYHPLSHFPSLKEDHVLQALVRTALRQLTPAQRENLSQIFQPKCQAQENLQGPSLFELPLTLALSKLFFEEEQQKKDFVLLQEWSVHPWVTLYTKLIYPEVKRALASRETLSKSTLLRSADACQELLQLIEFARPTVKP